MNGLEKKRAANEPRHWRESRLAGRAARALRLDLLLCLVLALVFVPETALAQDSAGEYELKAAMLLNLTRFVEWPASAHADAQTPMVLCILGRDPFGDSLTSIASNPGASGRAVQIRRIAHGKEIRGCHVVYISSSERKDIAQILARLKGTSVLTVGEMAQFAARGGMIQFSLEEKQVRFEVNLEAASESELKISSRLLVLARIVKEQSKNPDGEVSSDLPKRKGR
ncbi:MAG TPA: YfiR family protein [Candidatus Acidoferrum sp.]|nr:YfiR family protein [Candidatus Acidoferrum sp.]